MPGSGGKKANFLASAAFPIRQVGVGCGALSVYAMPQAQGHGCCHIGSLRRRQREVCSADYRTLGIFAHIITSFGLVES